MARSSRYALRTVASEGDWSATGRSLAISVDEIDPQRRPSWRLASALCRRVLLAVGGAGSGAAPAGEHLGDGNDGRAGWNVRVLDAHVLACVLVWLGA